MSPEHLWSSKLADVRSDIWSLGVILYELVCGRVPFGAATFSAQVLKVALEPLPAMDGPRHIPREFERVVQRCLEKDSARRFENVGCLATALQPFAPAASRPIVERIQRLVSEPDHVALEPSPTHRAPLDAPSPVSSQSTISRTRTSQPPARTSTMPSPIELEALADHEVWRRVRAPGTVNDIDASLRGDRSRTALGGRRWKPLVLAVAFALVGGGALLFHRMRGESHERLVRLYIEQGRQAVLTGDPMRGLVYLGEAYRSGARSRALDVLLGAATTALGEEPLSLRDPTKVVDSPEFSPDGRFLLTRSEDGMSQLWDAATGRFVRSVRGTSHRRWTWQSAFSPDSKRLALLRAGGRSVNVWNSATGKHLRSLSAHVDEVTAIVHSPDGERILTTSADASARIWSVETGDALLLLTSPVPIAAGAWSPEGRRVAGGATDGSTRIWDARTGRLAATLEAHQNAVQSVHFSPDGARIATASWDSTARIWDAESGAQLFVLRHERPVDTVVFSPNGSLVVTSSQDETAKVWDVETGALVHVLEGHSGPVFVAQFKPDGSRILTTGGDGTARLWDTATGDLVWTYVGVVWCASFDPTGTRVTAASTDGHVRVWDARRTVYQLALRGHTDRVGSARFSPDGTRLLTASSDRTIKLWEAATGHGIASTGPESTPQLFVAWSPDGTRFLTIEDRVAKIWNASTMRPLVRLVGHTAPLWTGGRAAFSPDGTKVVTGSWDRTARIWDANSGLEIRRFQGHGNRVNSAEFSPDGTRVVTASEDNTARIWNASTGALLVELEGHKDDVMAATFDRTGARVLTSSMDRSAKVWDAKTGELLTSLEGHSHQVNRSAFHPDGDLVVTSSIDGTARIWDSRAGRQLFVVSQPWIGEATFSPDGRRFLTAGRDGTAKIWEVPAVHMTPDELAGFIRCRVPYQIVGDRLSAATTDTLLCRTR